MLVNKYKPLLSLALDILSIIQTYLVLFLSIHSGVSSGSRVQQCTGRNSKGGFKDEQGPKDTQGRPEVEFQNAEKLHCMLLKEIVYVCYMLCDVCCVWCAVCGVYAGCVCM